MLASGEKEPKETEKGMEFQSMAPDRDADLAEKTFEIPIKVSPVQIDNVATMVEGAKTEVERDESGKDVCQTLMSRPLKFAL